MSSITAPGTAAGARRERMADLLLEFPGPEALARAARELQRKGYAGL